MIASSETLGAVEKIDVMDLGERKSNVRDKFASELKEALRSPFHE